jgi:hypothetical protein
LGRQGQKVFSRYMFHLLSSISELAPPTWAKKTIDNILKNMVISIKNLNIYYEVL